MRINRTALLCFFAVYVIWGSTYLAIKYAIETLPPFGMSSARFFIAGFLMYLISRYKKEEALKKIEKKTAILSGAFLILANGIVCVVEYWVPSGIVSVIIGAMPIWIMLMGWMFFHQAKPTWVKVLGSLIGLAGVGLITFGGAVPVVTGIGRFGPLFLIVSSLLWAAGTLIQKKAKHLKSIFRFSALQMVSGAFFTGIVSVTFERPWEYLDRPQSTVAIISFFYLVIFGSLVAFTAYAWLSRHMESHLVSTYALVNPIIAILLGSWFFKEPLSPDFLTASVLVIFGLALIIGKKKEIKNEPVAEPAS
jgi:drug/metabolite transporter (DMT)-like permease